MNIVQFGKACATFHEMSKHSPTDPQVIAAYETFKQKLYEQYSALPVQVISSNENPYFDSGHMRSEVAKTGKLYVYTFETLPIGHPLAQRILVSDNFVSFNFIFRAVHDYIGHIKPGNSFSYLGECRAFLAHKETLPEEVHGVLAAETLAQNSWYHFGPYKKTYAEQKAYIFPSALYRKVNQYVNAA